MTTIYLQILFSIMAVTMLACNENLPVRENVAHLVTTSIRSSYETTSRSKQTGEIRIFITIVNNTDEALDDIAQLTGSMEIVWLIPKEREPLVNITRTIRLTTKNLFYAQKFDRISNRLTVEAKDSVVFSTVWNLKSNDSTYLLQYFPWKEEKNCLVAMQPRLGYFPRRITLPQYFSVKANIKIFDRLAVLYVQPITVKHCMMIKHDGESPLKTDPVCTDFSQFDPCWDITQ